MEQKKQPVLLYAAASALVIVLDQWFKAWVVKTIPLNAGPADTIPVVPGLIHLTHIHNSGVAFGMLQGGRWIFLALLAAFCAVVVWALKTRKLTKGWERWLAVLAMAGALSNGIDRLFHGYVVDMLELVEVAGTAEAVPTQMVLETTIKVVEVVLHSYGMKELLETYLMVIQFQEDYLCIVFHIQEMLDVVMDMQKLLQFNLMVFHK